MKVISALLTASLTVVLAAVSVGAQDPPPVTISGSEDYKIPCPETGTAFPTSADTEWEECDIKITGVPQTGRNQITIEVIKAVDGGPDRTTTITCSAERWSCHHEGHIVAYLLWDPGASSEGRDNYEAGHWEIWIQVDVLEDADIDKFKVTAGSAIFERTVPTPLCGTGQTPAVDSCAAAATPLPTIITPTSVPVVCTNCDVDTDGDGTMDSIAQNLPTNHEHYAPPDFSNFFVPKNGWCIDNDGALVDMSVGNSCN